MPGTDSGTNAFAAKPQALAGLEAGFGMAGLIGGARPAVAYGSAVNAIPFKIP